MLEMLYGPPKQAPQVDSSSLLEKAIPYVDARVLSQNPPGNLFYLLMAAPRFLDKRCADKKQ